VPVFNEERRLPSFFERLDADAERVLARAGLRLQEVIVVDDGSTDRTTTLLAERSARDPALRVILLPANRGKGAAVRAGALAATSDVMLVTDVDLSTPLDDLVSLCAAIDQGLDVAMGSRALSDSRVLVHQRLYRELMGKTFNLMFRRLTGLPWRDTQCGFKLFRRETTKPLWELQHVERFAYDTELCTNAHRLGLRVGEVPVTWRNDPDTHVTLVGSSLRMAFDLVLTAWRARRPLTPSKTGLAHSSTPPDRA
jgi:glycosyltransferase involved in cell wall biosynthesis